MEKYIEAAFEQAGHPLHEMKNEVALLRMDAARYRWLRDKGSNTWVPFIRQWKMDAEHCDAAIDNEMANQRLLGDA